MLSERVYRQRALASSKKHEEHEELDDVLDVSDDELALSEDDALDLDDEAGRD